MKVMTGKDPINIFLHGYGGAQVSPEPAGSQSPLAQNNPHAKVPHLGEACSVFLSGLGKVSKTSFRPPPETPPG